MARWQLQCSGRSEEAECKFCSARLPNWRKTLFREFVKATPSGHATAGDTRGVNPLHRSNDDDAQTRASNPGMPVDSIDGGGGGGIPAGAPTEGDDDDHHGSIKGDIIVKFNGMSFRCQVKTGQEGLEDFMQQIRRKCGIPAEKMSSLNLTYRCKDPNTGSQMTLEGVNESAFDAAVLCSAAQDKLKQQQRLARRSDGGGTGTGRSRSLASSLGPFPHASPRHGDSAAAPGGHRGTARGAPPSGGGRVDEFGIRGPDASPSSGGRIDEFGIREPVAMEVGGVIDSDGEDAGGRFSRGRRRVSAPPPYASTRVNAHTSTAMNAPHPQQQQQQRSRRFMPSFPLLSLLVPTRF